MTAPDIPPQEREPIQILMDLLDACAITDREQPAFRYLSTRRLRELVVDGWRVA